MGINARWAGMITGMVLCVGLYGGTGEAFNFCFQLFDNANPPNALADQLDLEVSFIEGTEPPHFRIDSVTWTALGRYGILGTGSAQPSVDSEGFYDLAITGVTNTQAVANGNRSMVFYAAVEGSVLEIRLRGTWILQAPGPVNFNASGQLRQLRQCARPFTPFASVSWPMRDTPGYVPLNAPIDPDLDADGLPRAAGF